MYVPTTCSQHQQQFNGFHDTKNTGLHHEVDTKIFTEMNLQTN